ncbi:hypothetical protein Tco_1475471 [Tanacetum coccineum]
MIALIRVQTPSHVESTDDDNSDEEVQGANTEEEEMGRDTVMMDAPLPNVQATQETEDTHVILITPIIPEGQQQSSSVSSGFVSNMLNLRPDIGIDSIFNLNTETTLLVDVLVTTIAEPPLVFATTLPPPPTPLITHMQQTPAPTSTIVPSTSLHDLPNFGSLFGFDHRLKTLETDFFKFKKTNQFVEAVSSIPSIVDAYLANKMNEAVKKVVQLQSNRLRDEAQAEKEDFLNKLDDSIKKIIKDQVKQQVKAQVSKILPRIENTVNEQLEAEVMTLNRSNEQKNLYKALVEAYESDKLILDTYGDTVLFKRRKDDEDKDEEPSAGSNQGSKRRRAGKEPESTSAPKEKTSKKTGKFNEGSKSHHQYAGQTAQAEEPMHTADDFEKHTHQEFEIGVTDDQPEEETYPLSDWEFAHDVYFRCRIIAVTKLWIFEWHGYKHLDWITIRRDDDKLHTFKEGDFKRLPLQDIEDMLLLLIQGKLTNLNVEEHLAFSVSFRMFTRSIVIQRRVEDLQLDVKSYQKKLNITKPDSYRSDLK